MKLILLVQVFATRFIVGLISFVKVMHYPVFANVGSDQFKTYEDLHQRLTTWVVGPAMLVELATAVMLLKYLPEESQTLSHIGRAMVALTWLSTALLSVLAHNS